MDSLTQLMQTAKAQADLQAVCRVHMVAVMDEIIIFSSGNWLFNPIRMILDFIGKLLSDDDTMLISDVDPIFRC